MKKVRLVSFAIYYGNVTVLVKITDGETERKYKFELKDSEPLRRMLYGRYFGWNQFNRLRRLAEMEES